MRFVVKKQFGRGGEIAFAEFNEMDDAHFLIVKEMESDASMNIKVIYRIYEMNEMVKEYDPNKINLSSLQKQSTPAAPKEESGAQGKGSGASFRPTPFNTGPRPPGTPQKWMKDEDEDEKDKKK